MISDPRALLDAYAEIPNMNVIPLPFTPRSMAPLAFAALSAVLDLHKPEFRYPGDPEPTCAGCATHVTFTPYEKCKTVQAVLAALEAS